MKEKPILFSTKMVKAILDGKKTQTRRIIKPQPICHGPNITFNSHNDDFFISAEKGCLRCRKCGIDPEYSQEGADTLHYWKPQYQVGDILWVRETWRLAEVKCKGGADYFYYADGFSDASSSIDTGRLKWKPSIHMPRAAARIFLKVKNVRNERLQDITEQDAKAEGISSYWAEPHRNDPPFIGAAKEIGADLCHTRREAFQQLWNCLNTDRGYTWDSNPWVWVYGFEKYDLRGE